MSAYQHIAQRAGQVPVRQLCQVLRVAPSAYYAWQRNRAVPEPAWQVAVREAFVATASATAPVGYVPKCRPKAMRSAEGASVVC